MLSSYPLSVPVAQELLQLYKFREGGREEGEGEGTGGEGMLEGKKAGDYKWKTQGSGEELRRMTSSSELVNRRLSDSLSTQHSPQKAPQARAAERRPKGLPPFYWVPAVDRISEFEVSGSCGELVTKTGHYQDSGALQIASTMRMAAGGLYLWTLQIVQQCAERPEDAWPVLQTPVV
ncbi:hypothetical protein AK812_SmicGene6658 [Symbiodinium microadriaticum]|uniref:Uncharacterized protein n=1 Tax=Symbiodinium microadriaticum TaxID=2951 RepID=A0A1Q9EQJ0_SYMMI|nr:hypothetical protein AK812_SmicGene6658 [Symbiodinium microadriaticum]